MKLLVTSPLNVGTGRVLYYDVGRSASVVMLAQDGGFALRTNGLPEALMDTPGMPPRFSGEFWLSPLAVIARPQTRDMLIVGYGGGVVVEGVPPSVPISTSSSSSPRSSRRTATLSALRKRDPLTDPRVNVILNDARGALRLTEPPLRRHRLAAFAPVDRRRIAPLHARVHATRARSPDPGRSVRPVDERDLHGRRTAAFAHRDAARRVP